MPQLLRLLRLLALAIVTMVCAGLTAPPRGIVTAAGPIELAAPDSANPVRSTWAPRPSHLWRDAARRVADLKALEANVDEDDGDTLSDVADDPSVVVTDVSSPRKPARTLRGAPPIDTSRFAMGTGLPRGPPA